MRDSFFTVSLVLGIASAWPGCEVVSPRFLPRCADGQGLTTDAQGKLVCASAASPFLEVPPPAAGCPSGQGLVYYVGSPEMSCVDKTQGAAGELDGARLRLQIDDLAGRVASLAQTVAQLGTLQAVKEPLYVGNTRNLTTGRISASGKTGLVAATALCSAEFGALAHMCTPFELTRTVARGKLGPGDRIQPAWIYMPTWHNPKSSPSEPLSGLADNCGGYSTEVDTVGWTGMAVEWGPVPSGDVAFRWHGGDQAKCSASQPIACCQGGQP